MKPSPFIRALFRDSDKPHRLIDQRLGTVVATEVSGAFDSQTRRTGLLKHQSFPPGSAMIIAPTSAIHTFFMRFAIDVVFVSRDGRVLKIVPNLQPWRLAAAFRAFGVIEMPAGTCDRHGIQPGDMLFVD